MILPDHSQGFYLGVKVNNERYLLGAKDNDERFYMGAEIIAKSQ